MAGDKMSKKNWFDDDDVETIEKKTEKEELEEDNLFDGSEPADEDDVKCFEFGILIELKEIYLKHNPTNKLFSKNQPTKKFFQWYVDCCNVNKLSLLRTKNLSQSLQDMIEKRKEELDDYRKETLVEQYIEKNKQLLKRNEDLKNVAGNLVFLYELMSEKMDFKEGVEITEEELKVIEAIKEALGK